MLGLVHRDDSREATYAKCAGETVTASETFVEPESTARHPHPRHLVRKVGIFEARGSTLACASVDQAGVRVRADRPFGDDPEAHAKMHAEEDRLLAGIGVGAVYRVEGSDE